MPRDLTPDEPHPPIDQQPDARATDWPLLEHLLASPRVRTLYLFGPPGLGKTYAAYHYGRLQAGSFRLTFTEDTPASELRGHYVPGPKGLVWQDGPFTRALRQGARLVVNEVTHGSAEALSFLHPVLESLETACFTLPTGETVFPAPGFHVVCTDNAPPEDLPEALRDRFDCQVEVRDPHPAALAALQEPYRSAARRAFALEEERRISLRGWFSLQMLTDEIGLTPACHAVFGPERGARIRDALVLGSSGDEEEAR